MSSCISLALKVIPHFLRRMQLLVWVCCAYVHIVASLDHSGSVLTHVWINKIYRKLDKTVSDLNKRKHGECWTSPHAFEEEREMLAAPVCCKVQLGFSSGSSNTEEAVYPTFLPPWNLRQCTCGSQAVIYPCTDQTQVGSAIRKVGTWIENLCSETLVL